MNSLSPDCSKLKVDHERDGKFNYSLSFRSLFVVEFSGHISPKHNETKVYCEFSGELSSSFNGLVIISFGSNQLGEIRAVLERLAGEIEILKRYCFSGGEIDDKHISDVLVELLQSPKNNPKQLSISQATL